MNERQNKILELLTQNEKMEVKVLSARLGVSQVTIRKDLDKLAQKGLIIRNHGYATINSRDDINTRLAYHYEIKQKMALEAIKDIKDNEIVMIESGSSCALVALAIARNRKNVTIITNSVFISEYLRNENVRIILIGGEYQKTSQVLVGPIAIRSVKDFFVDKFFMGTDGFTERTGFTGIDYMRVETVQAMCAQAQHVIIVTESEKFGKIGSVNMLQPTEVYEVLTDDHLSSEYRQILRDQNVKVVTVSD